MCDTRTGGFH